MNSGTPWWILPRFSINIHYRMAYIFLQMRSCSKTMSESWEKMSFTFSAFVFSCRGCIFNITPSQAFSNSIFKSHHKVFWLLHVQQLTAENFFFSFFSSDLYWTLISLPRNNFPWNFWKTKFQKTYNLQNLQLVWCMPS